MIKLKSLKEEIEKRYRSQHPSRADWADWIYDGHVVLVGDEARKIAERFGGNSELAEAAGLLHDIADTDMKREDPRSEDHSIEIARELLAKTGYSPEEIAIVVDDAIVKHSCRGDVRPETPEGKAMAAADGVVHLTSDFYEYAERGRLGKFQSPQEIREWALPKIDRDFQNKIAFDELREEVRPAYEKIKQHFSPSALQS